MNEEEEQKKEEIGDTGAGAQGEVAPAPPIEPVAEKVSAERVPDVETEEGGAQHVEISKQEAESTVQETDSAEEPASEVKSEPIEQASKIETPGEAVASEPVQLEQTVPERVVEKVIEKEVAREMTEEEKSTMFKDRLRQLSGEGNSARTKRRQENLGKIVEYLKQHGYVTNDEVEKLCRVSDSTATRYLEALGKQGLVVQLGLRGRRLRWRLKQAT